MGTSRKRLTVDEKFVVLVEEHILKLQNLFANIPDDLGTEVFETIVASSSVKIERIISNHHASPDGFWYDQDQDEWVVVLQGAARIQFEDETIELCEGDSINIAARKKHRVDWTSVDKPTIWIAVHYGGSNDNSSNT